ncbi:MAG: hypothetical protein Q3976_06970 [Corynebacterium sp.]|nr:hypothetical protein [Corynebacterium sp.]
MTNNSKRTNIMLAPGESGVYGRDVRPNLALFWLTTTMVVTNKRILVRYPNTIFGIFPLGYEERSMPLGSIAGITSSLKAHGARLVIFGLLAFVGLLLMSNSAVLGLILFVFFALCAINAVGTSLDVTNNGGGVTGVRVSFLDKEAVQDFCQRANEFVYSQGQGGTSWEQTWR